LFEPVVATVGSPLQPVKFRFCWTLTHYRLQFEDEDKDIKTKLKCVDDFACNYWKAEEKCEETDVKIGIEKDLLDLSKDKTFVSTN
jgi:hypothetical protein